MKTFVISSFLLSAFLVNCTKKQDVEPSPISVSSSVKEIPFLKLSYQEYNDLKKALDQDFNPAMVHLDSLPKKNSQTEPASEMDLTSMAGLDQVNLIAKNEAIVKKYAVLDNFTSALSIYHKALLIRDPVVLKNLASKYRSFLIYVKELNTIVLGVSMSSAALLSPEGIIQVGKPIVQHGRDTIKVINDGDASKILLLAASTESHDSISVRPLNMGTPNERTEEDPTYDIQSPEYHLENSPVYGTLCQVVLVKIREYQFTEVGVLIHLATVVYPFFNGQLFWAPAISIYQVSAMLNPNFAFSYPQSGGGTGYNTTVASFWQLYGGFVESDVITGTNFVIYSYFAVQYNSSYVFSGNWK